MFDSNQQSIMFDGTTKFCNKIQIEWENANKQTNRGTKSNAVFLLFRLYAASAHADRFGWRCSFPKLCPCMREHLTSISIKQFDESSKILQSCWAIGSVLEELSFEAIRRQRENGVDAFSSGFFPKRTIKNGWSNSGFDIRRLAGVPATGQFENRENFHQFHFHRWVSAVLRVVWRSTNLGNPPPPKDTTMERNTLMAKCYPRIKDYCREKHGLEFQVIHRAIHSVPESSARNHIRGEVKSIFANSNCRVVQCHIHILTRNRNSKNLTYSPDECAFTRFCGVSRCQAETFIHQKPPHNPFIASPCTHAHTIDMTLGKVFLYANSVALLVPVARYHTSEDALMQSL